MITVQQTPDFSNKPKLKFRVQVEWETPNLLTPEQVIEKAINELQNQLEYEKANRN